MRLVIGDGIFLEVITGYKLDLVRNSKISFTMTNLILYDYDLGHILYTETISVN